MKIYCILKELLFSTISYMHELKEYSRIKKENPTCNFYSGAALDYTSKLEKYVVLFNNVKVVNSTIGESTFVQKKSSITEATIGKFCSIAQNVQIGLGNHPTSMVSTHPAFYSNTQPLAKSYSTGDFFSPYKHTSIGHDVWIGANAIVLDGVSVGTGAIIAAGAVVTKNVEPYAIVGGVPAKIIKYRFDKETINRLLRSQWWNLPENDLCKLWPLFSNPEKFLNEFKNTTNGVK